MTRKITLHFISVASDGSDFAVWADRAKIGRVRLRNGTARWIGDPAPVPDDVLRALEADADANTAEAVEKYGSDYAQPPASYISL